MIDKIFSKEKVNTGRQREIDQLKAFSIIMMIITHCIDDLSDYGNDFLPSVIINDILAQSIGAQGFMICMGLGVVFARRMAPKDYAVRGLYLLITGQTLNLVRYGLTSGIEYMLTGNVLARAWVFLVFSCDILQLAGLFFLCMAIFRKLDLSPLQIFAVSVAANIIGMATCDRISTGSYAVDQLLGMFIFTETESYFPLLHWMVYPAFGILFGDILQHVKDKRAFYARLMPITVLVYIIYYYIGIGVDQQVFLFYNDWRSFCHVGMIDVIMQLFCNVAIVCLWYFATAGLPDSAMRPINFISKNINRYYCVHSVEIYAISSALIVAGDGFIKNQAVTYLTALMIILTTSIAVWIYDKHLAKPWKGFFGKHTHFWYGVVILLSVIACAWSAAGASEFPNLMNDYYE